MQPIELKREPCDKTMSVALPASLKEGIKSFAEQNGVTESAAIRYIVSIFLSSDFRFSKVNDRKTKQNRKSSVKTER
jgi:hypothetical protein